MSALSDAEVIALWIYEGGSINTAPMALARAQSESSLDPTVTSANPDGGTNVGLYQLDTKGVGSGYTVSQLSDPFTNTKITVAATKNGSDWADWADNYQDFLSSASTAVAQFTSASGGNTSSYAKSVAGKVSSDGGSNAGSSGSVQTDASLSGLLGIPSSITGFFGDADDLVKALMWMVQPGNWVRIGAFFAGIFLVAFGIYALIRSSEGQSIMPTVVPVPV